MSRAQPGELNARAKLTQAAVRRMRAERAEQGTSFRVLAAKHGVCPMTAFRAATGRRWKEI